MPRINVRKTQTVETSIKQEAGFLKNPLEKKGESGFQEKQLHAELEVP